MVTRGLLFDVADTILLLVVLRLMSGPSVDEKKIWEDQKGDDEYETCFKFCFVS